MKHVPTRRSLDADLVTDTAARLRTMGFGGELTKDLRIRDAVVSAAPAW